MILTHPPYADIIKYSEGKIKSDSPRAKAHGLLGNSGKIPLPPQPEGWRFQLANDLSNIHSVEDFCNEIEKVARECFRVLKPDKYCAILIGDTRRNKFYIPLAFSVMERFLRTGFALREDIIKVQHNCRATGFWVKKSKEYNFLLIMHEHLFVFKKTGFEGSRLGRVAEETRVQGVK